MLCRVTTGFRASGRVYRPGEFVDSSIFEGNANQFQRRFMEVLPHQPSGDATEGTKVQALTDRIAALESELTELRPQVAKMNAAKAKKSARDKARRAAGKE